MKVFIFFCCVLVSVASQQDGGVRYVDWDVRGDVTSGEVVPGTKAQGSASVDHLRVRRATGFSYTAPDGTSRYEKLETYVDPRVRDGHPLTRVTGRVSWISPEGQRITQNYVADGSGYHPLSSRR